MVESTGPQQQEKAGSFVKPGAIRAPRKQLVLIRRPTAASELSEERPSLLQGRAAVRSVARTLAAQGSGGDGSPAGHDLSRVPTLTAGAPVGTQAPWRSLYPELQEVEAAEELSRYARQGQALPAPGSGPLAVTDASLPGGHLQRTVEIPFVQVLRRSRSDEPQTEGGQEEPEPPVIVSEVEGSRELELSRDSITATVDHEHTTARGGAVDAGDFGICRYSASFVDTTITPGSGGYTLEGTYRVRIRWQARTGTGPNREVDIQSDSDPDLRACNYQMAARDLTPNMADLGGRPPRRHFWAEDLTARHEQVHAVDYEGTIPGAATAARNYLNATPAGSTEEIENRLLGKAIDVSYTVVEALMEVPPGAEPRAYGDGAPVYQARADSIRTRGDAGDYGRISAEVTVHPRGGEPYEVVSGDTLWAIARRVYGDPRYWRDIYRANRDRVREGGNLIFPGTVLDLPPINVDQELFVMLNGAAGMYLSEMVRVPGGTSHQFLVPPNAVFSDATNCDGSVDVDVSDAAGNTLVRAVWNLPGTTTSRHGNYEVTASIAR